MMKLIEKLLSKAVLNLCRVNIYAILKNQNTGAVKVIKCHNLITDKGDEYYAQLGAGETPTGDMVYTTIYLGDTGSPSISKSSNYGSISFIANGSQLKNAAYPKTDDDDPDNTAAAVDKTTWRFDVPATNNLPDITEGIIAQTGASGTDSVLTHFSFGGAFTKDSSTTLKVIVNHEALGA